MAFEPPKPHQDGGGMSRSAISCKDYPELLAALNARRRQLGFTMEAFDERSGLTGGYSAKVFCGMRRFGQMSLPVVLETLGLELLVAPKDSAPAAPVDRTGSAGLVHHVKAEGIDHGR
jgi:hypothetical protein